jgi:hypothetical protein
LREADVAVVLRISSDSPFTFYITPYQSTRAGVVWREGMFPTWRRPGRQLPRNKSIYGFGIEEEVEIN